MTICYLSLGSNIGNRKNNLIKALAELKKNNIKIISVSSIYETESVGPTQRKFYNMIGKFKTNLSPFELLKKIKQIEVLLGRKKTYRWGPRVIDVDILFYGKQIIKSKNLIIPHKEISKRLFVLIPLNEVAPNLIHITEHKKIKTVLFEAQKKYPSVIEKI
jgi:2-amino-4-hydroxy-6-hydroxymethyldihydropteridine diphosphokinase